MQNVTKRMEAAISSFSATSNFLQNIHFEPVANNQQQIQSKCLVHEFSYTGIF